jgi:hypothetical protein
MYSITLERADGASTLIDAGFWSPLTRHTESMPMTHPHAGATYRTVPLKDGIFGVEIVIPGSHQTTMSSFSTEAKPEELIARHKGCGIERPF